MKGQLFHKTQKSIYKRIICIFITWIISLKLIYIKNSHFKLSRLIMNSNWITMNPYDALQLFYNKSNWLLLMNYTYNSQPARSKAYATIISSRWVTVKNQISCGDLCCKRLVSLVCIVVSMATRLASSRHRK